MEVGVGFRKGNQRMKNHANYFKKTPAKLIRVTAAMAIKFKLKEKLL